LLAFGKVVSSLQVMKVLKLMRAGQVMRLLQSDEVCTTDESFAK